ncbi:MAG: hypothetical protein NXI10_10055 [bacterium]|nr:hypothetical protein [bacterium]
MEDLIDDQKFVQEKLQNNSTISDSDKIELPYANSVYYKGIAALVFVFTVFGFMVSLYLMNIALKRSKEMLEDYKKSPQSYSQKSLKRVKIGRNLAYISLTVWIGQILAFLIIYN